MRYSKELKIGAFAVIVLVVSFFVINYLRGVDIFDREIEVVSRYDDVVGLVPSAPVFIKGYKAGKVADVVYDAERGDFVVTCSVLKDFRIPEDSKMTIYSVDIMGGKGVRIDLGTSESDAADGASLAPAVAPDLIGGLTESLGPLMAKVGNTIDSLNVTVSGVNMLLSAENQAVIRRSLVHLESALADASSVASAVEGRSDELSSFITNLSALSEKLTLIADEADTTIAGVNGVVGKLNESDIEGVVSSLRRLLDNINDPDGTVGRLFVDDSVYNSIDSLLIDVDSLVRKIKENPKKYLRISVF